ncbi:MAG: AraC family transcriptional regulator [Eubacteriales bacterium]|nr:AraC family transcriptional regulator [Eubacteriales bacterium]MDD3882993.1 AraC family transcriptional regulator [Eubacteriales bacterium]MDD4513459.1 AraC family transcriptional regulator [Eubacteriales bacterium]
MGDYLLYEQSNYSQSTKHPFHVEGEHKPDELAVKSGAWIHAAGSAMLPEGVYSMKSHPCWLWIAVEQGKIQLSCDRQTFDMHTSNSCLVPPDTECKSIEAIEESRIVWFSLEGQLADQFMESMGAVQHSPIQQGTLPAQIYLCKQIVQVICRQEGSDNDKGASSHLQSLLWSVLASYDGQPVSMDALLSHEIAKVIDAMRLNHYRTNYSLADMAAISRMPVETFRKRFVSEVGMPPQSYLLWCKMERAKTLLKQHYSVKAAGAEVGMNDPYHFSKQFKNIVGCSPTAYCKQVREPR